MDTYFKASHWDPLLVLITIILLISSIITIIYNPNSLVILSLVIIIGSSFFHSILGYSLKGKNLIIHRIGKNYKIDLNNLKNVNSTEQIIKSAWKLIGNGGLFAWFGTTKSTKNNSIELYATNKNNGVIINLTNRQIFVTPSNSDEFIKATRQLLSS